MDANIVELVESSLEVIDKLVTLRKSRERVLEP